MKDTTITARLSKDEKADFKKACANNWTNPSIVLLNMIREYTETNLKQS